MSFIRNFNQHLVKKSEFFFAVKKDVRTIRTVIAKPKESTGFYKIRRYFSSQANAPSSKFDMGAIQMIKSQNKRLI